MPGGGSGVGGERERERAAARGAHVRALQPLPGRCPAVKMSSAAGSAALPPGSATRALHVELPSQQVRPASGERRPSAWWGGCPEAKGGLLPEVWGCLEVKEGVLCGERGALRCREVLSGVWGALR